MSDQVLIRTISVRGAGRLGRFSLFAFLVASLIWPRPSQAQGDFDFDGGRGRGRGRRGRFAPPPPPRDIFPGNVFTFCTIQYQSIRSEALGYGWPTEYPDGGLNLMLRLSELTTIPINRTEVGEPNQVVMRLTDPQLFDYPMIFMSDVGTVGFEDAEVVALRDYLLRGGFLWADDFWGNAAWDHWESEIGRALPPDEYPIFDILIDHPIFHIVFDIKEMPQVPCLEFWERTGGGTTSERGEETAQPHMRGIKDKRGRLMVVMTHNTDIADGWEREGEYEEYFREFSVKKSYPLGINIVVYAMTH
jgi:hypothetical protein